MNANLAVGVLLLVVVGGCGFEPGDTPGVGTGDVDAPGTENPIDGNTSTPSPDAPVGTIDAAPGQVAPGGACSCDAQCADDGGQDGVCIYGV